MRCTSLSPTDPDDKILSFEKSFFFKSFRQEILTRFSECAHTQQLSKGHIVFLQDDPAELFYYIESGWVKIFRETMDGNEVILDVLPAGHVFAETALFHNHTHNFSAEMVEEGRLISLPLKLLEQEINRDPALAVAMLHHQAKLNHNMEREIEHRVLQNAPQRIGCFLLKLVKKNTQGAITLHLPYDKTLIAARLGMQPETFSRALSRLQTDADIKVRGPVVQIENIGKLISYTCSACTGTYPCKDR